MKNLLKLTTLSLVATTAIYASGYKIPETSTNSVALGGANIAHVQSADAAYDNPANMVFMSDTNHMEADLMYIGTSPTNFKGATTDPSGTTTTGHDISAEEQAFLIPSLHYVSPKLGVNDARIGVSVVVPGGLTREWKDQPAKSTAEEFSLQVIEINPTAAFKVSDTVGFAVGFRIIHSEGIVKSTSTASRDMAGDSLDFGYNFAFAYKPTSDLDFGLTYRSNVHLGQEGNAKLSIGEAKVYDGGATVSVPLPAALSIAGAYTFSTDTTVEFVYERTFWSAYESIDFGYTSSIPNILVPSFDNPLAKNWVDTNAFRLGLTQELDSMTLMAGVVFDETPTPEATLGFESPGSDSLSVSFGGRYELSENIDMGLGILYSMKEDRTVKNASIDGEFTDSNALLISAGLGYKF